MLSKECLVRAILMVKMLNNSDNNSNLITVLVIIIHTGLIQKGNNNYIDNGKIRTLILKP